MMPKKHNTVFFDIDGTIVARNVQLTFLVFLYRRGVITLVQLLSIAARYAVFVLGITTHIDPVFQRAFSWTNGWHQKELETFVDEFMRATDLKYYKEALVYIRKHKQDGHSVVLLTSIVEPLACAIGKHLGIEDIIATRVVIRDGQYTGELTDDGVMFGVRKKTAAGMFLEKVNGDWQHTWVYADSSSDIPLFASAGHSFVINPSRKLHACASREGYIVLRFTICL